MLSSENLLTTAAPPTWDDALREVKLAISMTLTDEDYEVFIDRPDNDRLHEAAVVVMQGLQKIGALCT